MSAIVARRAPGSATLADLLAIPEETRFHELIDGEIVPKEVASGKHGGAQVRISHLLQPFDREPGGRGPGGWIFASEVDIYFDPQSTLRPDVSGWIRQRLPELPAEVPIRVLPDWACEILSTNRRNDLIRKKRIYHQHHIPHCWIVDPIEQTLTAHRWSPEGYLEVLVTERGERVRAEPFDAIELQVGVFFGDDEEG